MKKLTVLNKRNNVEGIAVELENGRFQIEEAGEVKEVAASTFKRWFKVTGEVEEVEEVQAVEESTEIVVKDAKAEKQETRGGKCEKIVTKLVFNNAHVVITEYNGYVCDVVIEDMETGEVEYRSPKMSIKDALVHMGFEGEGLKHARKQIMALKKQAKLAI